MSAPRTRVAGPVVLPDGSAIPGNAEIVFTLRDWDRFTTSDGKAVAVEGQIIAPIVDGAIDVTLLRTVSGERGSFYDVAYRYWSVPANGPVSRALGSVSLTGASTVNFADLLLLPAPLPDVPDLLSQVQGTLAEAQALVVNADAVHEDRLAAEVAAATAAADANAQIAPNVAAAEAARDASEAFASAGASAAKYYDTIMLGRAAVDDGETFGVIAGGSDGLLAPTLYRRDSSSTQTRLVDQATQGNLATLRVDTARAFAHNLWADWEADWTAPQLYHHQTQVAVERDFIGGRPVLSVTTSRPDVQNAVYLCVWPASLFRSGKASVAVELLSADAAPASSSVNVVSLRQVSDGNLFGTAIVSNNAALPAEAFSAPSVYRIEDVTIDPTAKWVTLHIRRNGAANFKVGRVVARDGSVSAEVPTNAQREMSRAVEGALGYSLNARDLSHIYWASIPTSSGGNIQLGATADGMQIGSTVSGPRAMIRAGGDLPSNQPWFREFSFKVLGTSFNAVLAIKTGGEADSAGMILRWSLTGAMARDDGAGENSVPVVGQDASRALAVDDVGKLRIERDADGNGRLIAFRNGAQVLSTPLSDVPQGDLWIGVVSSAGQGFRLELREVEAGLLASAQDGRVDDLDTRVATLESIVSPPALRARFHRVLPTPPALAGRTPAGWTITGADVWKAGPLSGYIICSDDGRMVETDGSPYDARVHIVTPTFGRVVKSLTLPHGSAASTQGVAIDQADGSFWAASGAGDAKLRHFQAPVGPFDGGEVAAVEITGDAYDFGALGIGAPNGLAFDTDHGAALWCCQGAGATVRQIACDPAASPRVLQTVSIGMTAPDQIQFLSATSMPDGQARLLISYGSNGANGRAWLYNLTTGLGAMWAELPGSTAVEQLYYDPVSNILWATNDRGYHAGGASSGDPAVNNVRWYDMPPMPV